MPAGSALFWMLSGLCFALSFLFMDYVQPQKNGQRFQVPKGAKTFSRIAPDLKAPGGVVKKVRRSGGIRRTRGTAQKKSP